MIKYHHITIVYKYAIFADKSSKAQMQSDDTPDNQNASSWSLQNPHKFEIGCTVQYGEPAKHGVIKWIGTFPDKPKIVYAGLETVSLEAVHNLVHNYSKAYEVGM